MSTHFEYPLEEGCYYHIYNRGNDYWDYRSYPWSSYRRVLLDTETTLMKAELLDWFGGREEFVKFHELSFNKKMIEHLIVETD